MKKAVLYARVSSKKQEKEGFSIPAQINAEKNGIEIVKEFVEAETAKKAGRVKFNEMVSYLHEHEDQRIILVEKVDRLYRNLPDYGTIDDIEGLEIHFFKENEILSENSRSGIKFMIGIRVLMAKQYVDNLAEESAKGLNERVEQGYALYPPLVYKYGDDGTHKHAIIIDEERAKYAKRAFELFVYENLSAYTINNILYDEGLRTRQTCIDKADNNFYEQSNTILNFCKNAYDYFMTATPSQKRTVCEILGSNFLATGKELSITLYPVFEDIIELNKTCAYNTSGFELTETQSQCIKKATLGGFF